MTEQEMETYARCVKHWHKYGKQKLRRLIGGDDGSGGDTKIHDTMYFYVGFNRVLGRIIGVENKVACVACVPNEHDGWQCFKMKINGLFHRSISKKERPILAEKLGAYVADMPREDAFD